jgi:hypothetical protein
MSSRSKGLSIRNLSKCHAVVTRDTVDDGDDNDEHDDNSN